MNKEESISTYFETYEFGKGLDNHVSDSFTFVNLDGCAMAIVAGKPSNSYGKAIAYRNFGDAIIIKRTKGYTITHGFKTIFIPFDK